MAMPLQLTKMPYLALDVDNDHVAAAIARLAGQVMRTLDAAVDHNRLATIGAFAHGINMADTLSVMPSLTDDDWTLTTAKKGNQPCLPLVIQVRLPGPAKFFVQFDFHRDATLAMLAHQADPEFNSLILIREALDNELPDDFNGWISTVLTIWQKASHVRPRFLAQKRITFFDQDTQTGHTFKSGDQMECTLDLLRMRPIVASTPTASTEPKPRHVNWLVLSPTDKTSSVQRAVSSFDLVPLPSASIDELHVALLPYINDGHQGPLDYLEPFIKNRRPVPKEQPKAGPFLLDTPEEGTT